MENDIIENDPIKSGVFYFSFADDSGFLGGCYIEGLDFDLALLMTHALGINPGGSVRGVGPIPRGSCPEELVLNKLLNREELGDSVNWPDEEKPLGK